MTTIGSLCSGYEGIGLAVPGTLAYVCDPEPAAAHLLSVRHPEAPNLHDLKALAWAAIPVRLLTAGYPCQPFSGAGQRKGTDDPRHLWPYIAQGIALSRPPMVLLENVRGHLSLGWDTVLLDLHRLGYDVQWTLLRAADVGAPHGRARLFALAVDRDVHTWQAARRPPWARVEQQTAPAFPLRDRDRGALPVSVLVAPDDGLFGSHPLPRADNGHVPMPAAGLMVDGVVWEREALLGQVPVELLPTPQAVDAKQAKANTGGNPTLTGAICGWGPRDIERHGIDRGGLLPTPDVAMAMGGHATRSKERSGELLLPGVAKAYADGDLLPTPCTTDANGARNSTSGRQDGSTAHAGDTLSDLVYDGRLAPLFRTPTAQLAVNGGSQHPDKRTDGGHGPTLADEVEHLLLPTPVTEPATGNGHARNLSAEVESRWGRYAAAVARCEALTRPAPSPTLPTGRGGAHRLSPAFVEWMMMLPDGWVTDPALWTHLKPSAARNVQLKLLGNGVVPAQAAAAWRHLTAGLRARQVAA